MCWIFEYLRNIIFEIPPGIVLLLALIFMWGLLFIIIKALHFLLQIPIVHRCLMPISQWVKYKVNISTFFSILLIFSVCLAFYLGFLVSYESGIQEDVESTYKASILYGVQTVLGILDGDSQKLEELPDPLSYLGWFVSWIIPVLTVSTIITMLVGFVPRPLPPRKEYFIFSQLEERSLLLAEDLMQKENESTISIRKDRTVIFLRIIDKDKLSPEIVKRLSKIGAKVFSYTEADLLRIHWRLKRKKIRFFFLSSNTEINYSRMQLFLQEVKEDRLFMKQHLSTKSDIEERQGIFRQELYLLSEAESSPMLIDHLRKQLCVKNTIEPEKLVRLPVFAHTELRLLDRYRTVMYDLLQEKPLYKTADNGNIRILILGFGRVGKAFYRAAISFSSMMGYSTTFSIRDKDIDRQWESLELEYPLCKEDVILDSQSMNVQSKSILELITQEERRKKPFTYIVLSLGDDETNIEVASQLARYYRQIQWTAQHINLPTICVNLENKIRSDYVSEFFMNDTPCVPLHVFGTDHKTFSENMLIARKLWNAARKLHIGLKDGDKSCMIYWSEYERRSSVACVAHAPYCVESLKPYMGNHSYDEAYKQLKDSIKAEMAKAEHERWEYYSRSEGMRRIDVKIAKKILKEKKHHSDPIAQLTPCMIDMEKLGLLYHDLYPDNERENNKRIKEGKPPYRAFVERDHFVVSNAGRLNEIISENRENIELKGYDNNVNRKK